MRLTQNAFENRKPDSTAMQCSPKGLPPLSLNDFFFEKSIHILPKNETHWFEPLSRSVVISFLTLRRMGSDSD